MAARGGTGVPPLESRDSAMPGGAPPEAHRHICDERTPAGGRCGAGVGGEWTGASEPEEPMNCLLHRSPFPAVARAAVAVVVAACLPIFLASCARPTPTPARSTGPSTPPPTMPTADARPAAPSTQTVTIRRLGNRAFGDSGHAPVSVPVRVELVRLPDGQITIDGPDGKPATHMIRGLWMAKYETTWVEYYIFAHADDLSEAERNRELDTARRRGRWWGRTQTPFQPPDNGWGIEGYPVNCVTVSAARRYCQWLSAKTGKRFRLPTEAEWDYACRAGAPPVKPDARALREIAWFADNAEEQPHPVGQKKPNAWGLYDMLGNVGEYVIRDPDSNLGLIAGGSWRDEAKEVHCGAREEEKRAWAGSEDQDPLPPDWRDRGTHHLGFRVVMEE